MKTRICHICGTETGAKAACPTCEAAFETRRDAATMTREERLAEFDQLEGPLEIPWPKFHQRMEELLARPVWTHEFANFARLREELANGQMASVGEVIDELVRLADGKPVIIVGGDPA